LKGNWNETDAVWKSGDWNISASEKKVAAPSLSLQEYLSSSWRDKLVIRQSGTTYFDSADREKFEKITYGIHMHTVLSRMKYADEIESMLDQIIFEGMINEEERGVLRDQLTALLNIPEVGHWFSRSWKVETEVPILLPGGGESRLDRLIHQGKKAIVIDFKTGEKKKNDNQQVLQYIDILRQMNFPEVEGYLLYLRDRAVVEVKAGGKQRVVEKKKDRDQLSLGF
jgi:hypothetical protein